MIKDTQIQTIEEIFEELNCKLTDYGFYFKFYKAGNTFTVIAIDEIKYKFKDIVIYNGDEYIFQKYADNNIKKAYIVGENERVCVPVNLLRLS